MKLGMRVGLGPGHIVLDWDPAPLPQYLAISVVARWLHGSRCHLIVLGGNPAPLPQKGVEPPIFGTGLLWPNGCMDQDATW